MGHPDQALQRLKKLAQDSSAETDLRSLAVFCLELESALIKPLRQQVLALERRVMTLEAEAVFARRKVSV